MCTGSKYFIHKGGISRIGTIKILALPKLAWPPSPPILAHCWIWVQKVRKCNPRQSIKSVHVNIFCGYFFGVGNTKLLRGKSHFFGKSYHFFEKSHHFGGSIITLGRPLYTMSNPPKNSWHGWDPFLAMPRFWRRLFLKHLPMSTDDSVRVE